MEKFRDDKAWYECMTVPEVQEMKDVSNLISEPCRAEQTLAKFLRYRDKEFLWELLSTGT